MRQGRNVREGCQPMKWVKQRAVTVNKKRAIEMALAGQKDLQVAGEGGGTGSEKDVMQGLYAVSQTELYVPIPVLDVSTEIFSWNRRVFMCIAGYSSEERFWKYRLVCSFHAA